MSACAGVKRPGRQASDAKPLLSRRGSMQLLWLSLLSCLWFLACSGANAGLPTTSVQVGGQTLTVELAQTPGEQARGLMYRKEMADNAGMLFVYRSPQPVAYWMKNTFLPLSIAFIDANHRIVNMADMAPNNETRTYPSEGPVQYVLEVNQGWFARNGVKRGDLVTFDLPHNKGTSASAH